MVRTTETTPSGSLPSVCVFPSCGAFGTPIGLTGRRFCEACGRPFGGPRFGRTGAYRVRAFLGSGYFADVFEVVDLGSRAPLAAKLYRDEPAKRQAASWELEALQTLSHPRLPAPKEAFEDGAWLFVVMELVEGPNLRDEVEGRGPLTVDQAVRLGIDVCEALEHVGSRNWTYRDLHPRNVHRATPKGTMLLDLDNARPARWPAHPAGRAGYRAPELEGSGAVTLACDVYGLAGCLYFALTGEDPPLKPGPLADARGLLSHAPRVSECLDACRLVDPGKRPSASALRLELAAAAP